MAVVRQRLSHMVMLPETTDPFRNTSNKRRLKKWNILQVITQELGVQKWQVEAAVKLIDEGNTIPFISRYRKEATGTLNDEQLRNLNERLTYLRNLEDKKNQVLSSIEDQGKLTEELKAQILAAQTLVVVEDLYRPYRPKRRTRQQLPRKKVWTAGQYYYASDDRQVHRGRSRSLCFRGKRGCFCDRCHCWCRRTLLQSIFPMRQIIESTSVILLQKKELSVLRQKIRRHSLYMRCIMSLKSR